MSETIVIFPALFATLAFVFWVLLTEFQRRSRLKLLMDFRSRLLDRLTSAADIAEVLRSEGGAGLLREWDEPSWGGFQGRVVRTAQVAVVLFFIGAGLFTLAWLDSFGARAALTAFAVMALFVAAGFGVSAMLAWRLGTSAGLIEPSQRGAAASQER